MSRDRVHLGRYWYERKEAPNIFYVYLYLRARASKHGPEGSPYYVGKGKGNRAFVKPKGRGGQPPKDTNRIVKVADGMSEPDALQSEMWLIHLHGRLDKHSGCLINRTDGGDGLSNPSDATRKIMSERRAKYWASLTEDEQLAISGNWVNAMNHWREKLAPEEKQARKERLNAALLAHWASTPRKTHCPKGHPYTEENVYKTSNGGRSCRICRGIDSRLAHGRGYVRKTHCPKGHPYDVQNAYMDSRGTRHCRTCEASRPKRTHCSQGHPYDVGNTSVKSDGSRVCRTCRNGARRARHKVAGGLTRSEAAKKRQANKPKKTHCPHGHPYNEWNTRTDSHSGRYCKVCVRERVKSYYHAKRTLANSPTAYM